MLYPMKCVMCFEYAGWVGEITFTHLNPPFPFSPRTPQLPMTVFRGKPMDCTEGTLVFFGIFSSAVSAVSYCPCPFG